MGNKIKSVLFRILVFVLSTKLIWAQQEISYKSRPVSFPAFLSGVVKGNLGYIANQFNVSIAKAELKASQVFPDPEIALTYGYNEDRRLQMGQSFEAGLSYPVNTANRRGANIALARSNYELSEYLLDAFFQNLRADAALSYFATLRNQRLFSLQQDIYKQLSELARADSIRLASGDATGLDALQSSLEARSQLTEVYQSLSEFQNSSVNLMLLQGKKFIDTLEIPSGNFPVKQREFRLNELIDNSLNKRADLMAALKNREVSEKNLNLIKANRAFEFNLETGYSYNSIVKNEIAPAPAYNGLTAGISFPLKFSSLNKGSIAAADLAVSQSRTAYEETELQIITEVIMAYNNFVAQNKKVEHYNQGLAEDALKILEGRIYSYQQGESGLIEVLNAQRTYIELQLNQLEALFDYTSALIELERAAGIWDLSE
ncbi:MAG TPA: TolC family protein [Bacteroidales bacterium]|jgi:cobalt-zinc-cadmium efflux system outer membrane protein|nr:TolC family protein [Bacteroidales bacterium]